ncbi:MAG: hypothetical protein ACRDQ5_25150 [Sciscionella sp.]
MLSRALMVLGGTILGTAAAWAISSASAAASTLTPDQPAPDQPGTSSVSEHAHHRSPSLLGDTLVGTARDLGSTATKMATKMAEPVLRKTPDVADGIRHAAELPTESQQPGKSGGLDEVVHGVIDTVDHNVDTDLTAPLDPITRPVLSLAGGRHDTVRTGNGSPSVGRAVHEVAPKPRHQDDVKPAKSHQPARGTAHRAGCSASAHPVGSGLPSAPDTPLGNHQHTPLTMPSDYGSSSHDGASSNSHTSAAGAASDVSLPAYPALLASLLPAAHQVKPRLAEAPGSTPD